MNRLYSVVCFKMNDLNSSFRICNVDSSFMNAVKKIYTCL
jgi:hypothetical protein